MIPKWELKKSDYGYIITIYNRKEKRHKRQIIKLLQVPNRWKAYEWHIHGMRQAHARYDGNNNYKMNDNSSWKFILNFKGNRIGRKKINR